MANSVQGSTEQLKSGDAELIVKGSRTLVDLCIHFEQSEEHRAETFSLGALDVLVEALRNHPGNAEVQARASFALGNQSAYSEERSAEAFKLGALDLLVEALRNHPGNAEVQARASFALGNVCRYSQKHKAEAFSLGALDVLVEALRNHETSTEVQALASFALGNACAYSEERSAEAFTLGALDLLVKGLRNHETSTEVQALASFALGSVCGYSQKLNAEAFTLGALDLLVKGLRNHPGNAEVQAWASFALGNVCRYSQKHKAEAFTLGTLDLLVKGLRNHETSTEVQAWASFALGNVCWYFKKHKAEAFTLGALDLLVKGLRNHETSTEVQAWASYALGNVCGYSEERSAEAFTLGALDLLVKGLRNHPGNAEVQAWASFALGNVCDYSEERSAEAFTLGALDLLVEALRNHPGSANVQRMASYGLGQVCWGSSPAAQARRERAIELGAFELIVSKLPPTPSGRDYIRFWALGSLCFGSDPAALDRQQKALSLGTLEQVELMLKEEDDMQEQGTAVLQLLKKKDKHKKKDKKEKTDGKKEGRGVGIKQVRNVCRMVLEIVSAPWSLWQWAHPASSRSTNPAAESSEASPQSREAREATETSPSEAARKRRGVAEAEKDLQAAIKSRDANRLRKAIQEAEKFGVEKAILYEAQKALTNLVESGPMSPSIQLLQDEADDLTPMAPMGIQICHAIDALFQLLTHEHEASKRVGRETLERCCQKAQKTSDELLKSSIFGLMAPGEIEDFLLAADHRMWMEIRQNTEEFLNKLLNEPGIRVEDRPKVAEMMRPDAINSHLPQMRPVIMDHTVREPATTTPFGHTGYMKWLTLKIIQKMNIKDIAISGQYYGSSYTPETQILEWLHYKGESMDGMVVMFAPGEREAGIKAIRDYQIPNAFLDLTLKASVRFEQTNFATTVQNVLDAVEELDQIFTNEMGLAREPWRNDEEVNSKPGSGEISLNLVDLMEFLDLEPDLDTDKEINPANQKIVEDAFAQWKANDAFQRRVVAILTEEGRGCALHKDYGKIAKWLRNQFPEEEKYRILIHAHAGPGNTQDAASIEAVLHGGNGVWAGIIPQAAQGGHNSSLVFLDNMLRLGNEHVLEDYWLYQAAQSARYVYYLSFNTYKVPDDCPIWGAKVDSLTHTAFSTVKGEEWRRKRSNYYNMWGQDEKVWLKHAVKKSKHHREVSLLRIDEESGAYRLSPLVSDVKTWKKRLGEDLSILVEKEDIVADYVTEVRMLAFAMMNAGLRANFDAPNTLCKLVEIVKRNKAAIQRCRQVHAYQKAEQHQGDHE